MQRQSPERGGAGWSLAGLVGAASKRQPGFAALSPCLMRCPMCWAVVRCAVLCCAVLCCADVDFDDYHVWAALQEAKYRPRVVSIEVSSRMAAWLHGCMAAETGAPGAGTYSGMDEAIGRAGHSTFAPAAAHSAAMYRLSCAARLLHCCVQYNSAIPPNERRVVDPADRQRWTGVSKQSAGSYARCTRLGCCCRRGPA